MKATLKVDTYKVGEFLKALEEHLVPLMEDQGWRLHGCFVERFGSIKPAVVTDIWEMEDMAHVERVLNDYNYRSDPRYLASLPVLESAVLEEKVEFMQFRMGRLATVYS
jgi:hypothetical protein